MALKNYTTDVPVSKTVSEIHIMLAEHGASKIMFDYFTDGRVKAITFAIATKYGEQAVQLPANADRVLEVLKQQKANPKSRASIIATPEQAERVAWRIVRDWLSAQLAILETEMVEIQQVFLPYMVNRAGETVYDLYTAGQLLLGE